MYGRVVAILELLRDPGVWDFLGQQFGPGDRSAHALAAGREHQLGTEQGQQRAAFQRHGLGHGQDDLVALGGGDEGQRDPGVAGGRFDDGGARLEHAATFSLLDHGHADAVLHGSERVEELALEQYLRGRIHAQTGGNAVQADERRAPDGLDDVVVDAAHKRKVWKRVVSVSGEWIAASPGFVLASTEVSWPVLMGQSTGCPSAICSRSGTR